MSILSGLSHTVEIDAILIAVTSLLLCIFLGVAYRRRTVSSARWFWLAFAFLVSRLLIASIATVLRYIVQDVIKRI